MITYSAVLYSSQLAQQFVNDIPLPLAFGDVKTSLIVSGVNLESGEVGYNAQQFIVSTDVIEGTESYNATTILGDDAQQEQITKLRVSDAQAGYVVVGVADRSVVESEFENYQYWRIDGANAGLGPIGLNELVLYRGVLKVSKTQVYTPAFLNGPANVQFRVD